MKAQQLRAKVVGCQMLLQPPWGSPEEAALSRSGGCMFQPIHRVPTWLELNVHLVLSNKVSYPSASWPFRSLKDNTVFQCLFNYSSSVQRAQSYLSELWFPGSCWLGYKPNLASVDLGSVRVWHIINSTFLPGRKLKLMCCN